MIIVPILASLGIQSPKTFSKAITSPAATGECVETLMNINFTTKQMKKLVKDNNACLARGKNLRFAPANDKIIKVSHPIAMEAYAKMVVSIMAKIYA
jgi:thymidine phosphorylase